MDEEEESGRSDSLEDAATLSDPVRVKPEEAAVDGLEEEVVIGDCFGEPALGE